MPKNYDLEDLNDLIAKDKLDELEFALKDMSGPAIKRNLSNALGQHIEQNYDIGMDKALKEAKKLEARPLLQKALKDSYEEAPELEIGKLFEQKLEKPVKLKIFNEPGAEYGYVDLGTKKPLINLNEAHFDKINPRGVATHETAHLTDLLQHGYIPPEEESLIQKMGGIRGLKATEEALKSHHKGGFLELEALKKLTKNKLLQAVPVLGAGLIGHEILKTGNVFAADPTGLTSSENIGEGSDIIPADELAEKQRLNNRMKKMRTLMGAE